MPPKNKRKKPIPRDDSEESDEEVEGGGKAPRANYDDREKAILMEIIKTMDAGKVYKQLLNKSAKTCQAKFDLWVKITNQFNDATGRNSDRVPLRKLFGRLQNKIRKDQDAAVISREQELRRFQQNCAITGSGLGQNIPQEVDGDLVDTEVQLDVSMEPIRTNSSRFTGPSSASGSGVWLPGSNRPMPAAAIAQLSAARAYQDRSPTQSTSRSPAQPTSRSPPQEHRPEISAQRPTSPAASNGGMTPRPDESSDEDAEDDLPLTGHRDGNQILLFQTQQGNGASGQQGNGASGQRNPRRVNPVSEDPPANARPKKAKVRQSRVQAATEYYSQSLKTKTKLSKFQLGNMQQTANIKYMQLRMLQEEAAKGNVEYTLPFPQVNYPNLNLDSSDSNDDSEEN